LREILWNATANVDDTYVLNSFGYGVKLAKSLPFVQQNIFPLFAANKKDSPKALSIIAGQNIGTFFFDATAAMLLTTKVTEVDE